MNNKILTTSTSPIANPTSEPISLDEMKKVAEELQAKRLAQFAGMPIMEDISGMMVPDNGFVVVVGKKLYQQLCNAK